MKDVRGRLEVLSLESHVAKLRQQMKPANPELYSCSEGETGSSLMGKFRWPFGNVVLQLDRIDGGIDGTKRHPRIDVWFDAVQLESPFDENGEIPAIHTRCRTRDSRDSTACRVVLKAAVQTVDFQKQSSRQSYFGGQSNFRAPSAEAVTQVRIGSRL